MTNNEVVKYAKPVRVLHWIHTVAFVLLFLTGLALFVPQLGFLAQDSWTRLIHRIAALTFVIAPLIYLPFNWTASWRGIKQAFTWGAADMGWLKAAPGYYFLGDEKGMPPQGAMNAGQKLWWLMVIVFGLLFVATGIIMWFFKATAPAALLQWMVFLHDISFIVSGAMLLLHIYLGVFHPLMTEAWSAMSGGKISVEYAKAHHGKWYNEVAKAKEK